MIGINLAGAEFGKVPGVFGHDYVYPTADELDYFKSQGMDVVRLPFLWERVQPTLGGALDGTEVARIHEFLDEAAARGMQVVLDVHNYGRYNGHTIGSSAVPISAFADLWARLANEFDGDPAVRGFGLMNEPHDMGGAQIWPAAAQAAVDAIRATGSQETIIVSGDGWSSASRWEAVNGNLQINDPLNKLLYEAHIYFDDDNMGTYNGNYDQERATPTTGVQRLAPFLNWLQEHHAQGFIGEFGAPANDPRWLTVLDNFVTALNDKGIDGIAWAAGPAWGAYPLSLEPKNGEDKPQIPILTQSGPSSVSPDSVHVIGDTILGSAVGDVIDASRVAADSGLSHVFGLAGDDTLISRSAPDVLDGGAGSDTASYVASTAAVNINLGTEAIHGGAAEGDIYTSIENVTGSDFNDRLEGSDDPNRLDGGNGTDTVSYQFSKAGVTVDLRLTSPQVSGGSANGDVLSGFENVVGTAFDDVLTGTTGPNGLEGGAGNDTLDGGFGTDTLVGGPGDDTFIVDFAGDVLVERPGEGTDLVRATIGVTLPGNIEDLTLLGDANVNGNGNGLDNVLIGNEGRNTLTGLAGNDSLTGGAGDDTLIGSAGADHLDGGLGVDTANYAASAERVDVSLTTGVGSGGEAEGDVLSSIENLTGSSFDDIFEGNGAANRLDGGAGADTVTYEHSDAGVTVNLGSGAPQVSGGDANGDVLVKIDNLIGSPFDDSLTGNASGNILTGGAGNDTLNGSGGPDTMIGGTGDDLYVVDFSGDVVIEQAGEGSDTVNSTISQTLGGNVENLTLLGSLNTDGTGNSLNNTLTGSATANRLSGLDGNDVLTGGGGADVLTGGAGLDTFVFEPGFGRDTITDFSPGGGDVVQFDHTIFADFDAVMAASKQVGGDVVIAADSSNTVTLRNVTLETLHANDFLFV